MIERSPKSSARRARASSATVLGARRVSPVIVTRVSPRELRRAIAENVSKVNLEDLPVRSVRLVQPYSHNEAMDVAGVRKRTPQHPPKSNTRVQQSAALSKKQRPVARWNDEHRKSKQPNPE